MDDMNFLIKLLFAFIVLLIVAITIRKVKEKEEEENEINTKIELIKEIEKKQENSFDAKNYKPQRLVTNNEYELFIKLKKIADTHNLIIMSKVRLADIFTIIKNSNKYSTFNYIASKHIDFMIYSAELYPLIAIELQDISHNEEDRQESDNIKTELFKNTTISLMQVKAASIAYETLEKIILDTIIQRTKITESK